MQFALAGVQMQMMQGKVDTLEKQITTVAAQLDELSTLRSQLSELTTLYQETRQLLIETNANLQETRVRKRRRPEIVKQAPPPTPPPL